MKDSKYIYYLGEPGKIIQSNKPLDGDYFFEMWEPKITRIAPKRAHWPLLKVCLLWWFLNYLKIFSNTNYCIALIYHAKTGELAHYSVALPRYFRFDFMGKNDLQIGPITTSDEHQRKGLASFAIQKIIQTHRIPGINFWYLTREENAPSKKLIENFGFTAYGEGKRAGILKRFIIDRKY